MQAGQIFSLIVLVAFIFGLFYLRSYVLKKASGQNWGRLGTRNIVILERFAIAKDKMFCLAEVGGKVYFVVFTNQSATLIDTIKAAEFYESAAVPIDKNSADSGFFKGNPLTTGDTLYARMTRGLARFIAKKTGREATFEEQLARAIDADKANNADKPEEKP
jgi:flagellar biogenesis protein FliO